MSLQPAVNVKLPDGRSYAIYVEYGLSAWLDAWRNNQLLADPHLTKTTAAPAPSQPAHSNYFLISEKGLPQKWRQNFLDLFTPYLTPRRRKNKKTPRAILLKGGESCKNIRQLAPIYENLIAQGIDRQSCLIALGGGIVGDLTGFVAASILRGIDFIQVPTTLLAAVDASVGGKVGVNTKRGKNMVGAFHQPRLVYFNLEYLQSLPAAEWTCGLSEMLKHGLIEESGQVLAELLQNTAKLRDPQAPELRQAIIRSIQVKARVVNADEKERGIRAILNLGHTTAHALESLARHRRFSHGAAVSRGIVSCLLLSHYQLGLAWDYVAEIIAKMAELGLPRDTARYPAAQVYAHMAYDKKNVGGQSRFVLLQAPGQAVWNQSVDALTFQRVWQEQARRFG